MLVFAPSPSARIMSVYWVSATSAIASRMSRPCWAMISSDSWSPSAIALRSAATPSPCRRIVSFSPSAFLTASVFCASPCAAAAI